MELLDYGAVSSLELEDSKRYGWCCFFTGATFQEIGQLVGDGMEYPSEERRKFDRHIPGTGDIKEDKSGDRNGRRRDRTEGTRICGTRASTLFLFFLQRKYTVIITVFLFLGCWREPVRVRMEILRIHYPLVGN